MRNKFLRVFLTLLLVAGTLPGMAFGQGSVPPNKVDGDVFVTRSADITTGEIFWVDSGSGSDDQVGRDPKRPLATLDAAIGKCALGGQGGGASTGCVIYLMTGHAENLSAADSVDVDVAGVSVIGLGTGSNRPTFTGTVVAGEYNVDAANHYLENVLFLANVENTHLIELTANADGFHVNNIEMREGGDTPVLFIDMVGQADGVIIEHSVFRCPTADKCDSAIDLSALTPDRFTYRHNLVYGDFDLAGMYGTGAATNVHIHNNSITNLLTGAHAVEFTAASLGNFNDNRLATDLIATALDSGSLNTSGNLWNDATGDEAGASPIPEYSAYIPGYGYRVTKQLDFETDPDVLFTVTGLVAITLLVGEITTACSASCDMLLETSNNNAIMTVSAMDLDADGTIFIITGDLGGAQGGADLPILEVAGTGGVPIVPIIVGGAGDTVTLQNNPGTADTGQATMYLFYIPLSPGATVVAA